MKLIKLYLFFILICPPFFISARAPGSFTPVVQGPVPTGNHPSSVSISPISMMGYIFTAVSNMRDDNISVFTLNQATGALFTAATVSTGTAPSSVSFSPITSAPANMLSAAAANSGTNNVSVYSVQQTSGAFTEISGSPFAAGDSSSSVAFSPVFTSVAMNLSVLAAVTNRGNDFVSVYSVDQTSGAFTEISGSPFAAGDAPSSVAFSPFINDNVYAAVVNQGDNTIQVYFADPDLGFISTSLAQTGADPVSVAFSPEDPAGSGNLFVAVANQGDSTVSVYQVYTTGDSSGIITEVPGSPFPAGVSPSSVAYSPLVAANLFAAVTNSGGNNVSAYQDPDGALYTTAPLQLRVGMRQITGVYSSGDSNFGDSASSPDIQIVNLDQNCLRCR